MAKVKPIKDRVKAKVKDTKKKVKGKLKGAAVVALFASLFAAGCLDTAPASRATTATYRIDARVCLDEGVKSVTVNMPFTFGDGALASADSAGSTETQTATPTVDVRPDVNVNYAQGGGITNRGTGGSGGGTGGILESLTVESLSALKDFVVNKKTGKVTLKKKDGSTVTADCKDGDCTFSDGTTVTAEECADCELPGWVEEEAK